MPLRRMLSKRKPSLAVDTRILEVMCTTQRMMACQHFWNHARCRTFGIRQVVGQVVGLAPLVAMPALAVDACILQVICTTHSMLASQHMWYRIRRRRHIRDGPSPGSMTGRVLGNRLRWIKTIRGKSLSGSELWMRYLGVAPASSNRVHD